MHDDDDLVLLEALALELKKMPNETILAEISKMNRRLGIIDEEVKFIHDIIGVCRKEINERLARLAD